MSTGRCPTSTAGPSRGPLWWGGWLDNEQHQRYCQTHHSLCCSCVCFVKLPTEALRDFFINKDNRCDPVSTEAGWDTQSHTFLYSRTRLLICFPGGVTIFRRIKWNPQKTKTLHSSVWKVNAVEICLIYWLLISPPKGYHLRSMCCIFPHLTSVFG